MVFKDFRAVSESVHQVSIHFFKWLKNYIACNLSDRLLWGRVYLVGKA
jgi:hypothetical protein